MSSTYSLWMIQSSPARFMKIVFLLLTGRYLRFSIQVEMRMCHCLAACLVQYMLFISWSTNPSGSGSGHQSGGLMYISSSPISLFRKVCLVSDFMKVARCLAPIAMIILSSVALITGVYSSPALKRIHPFCWLPIAHSRTFRS